MSAEPIDTAATTCTVHPQSMDAMQKVVLSEIWHHKATMNVLPTDAMVTMVFKSINTPLLIITITELHQKMRVAQRQHSYSRGIDENRAHLLYYVQNAPLVVASQQVGQSGPAVYTKVSVDTHTHK